MEDPVSRFGSSGRQFENKGWYRRYLPHRDEVGLCQVITYRLGDSVPQEVLARMEAELAGVSAHKREAERRKRIEDWSDAGWGSCVLREPEAARCVVETWKRFHGERYDLMAWVVMPNHVHVMIQCYAGVELGKIVQSWKSYTGRRIGEMIRKSRAGARGSQGGVWMREYWDRFIRDEKHYCAAVDYIHLNPVKAKLVGREEEWLWSSAWKDRG